MALTIIGGGYAGGEDGGVRTKQTTPYSDSLIAYIGRTELDASNQTDSFRRYMCFVNALSNLGRSGLLQEDIGLAKKVLVQRIRDTKPPNMGIASSDGGGSEAD